MGSEMCIRDRFISSSFIDDKNTTNTTDDELINLSIGNYTGFLNVTVLESGISNYTNITLEILNDSIGRVLVNVTDDAGQPIYYAKVIVYYNLTVTERGYTDENGTYCLLYTSPSPRDLSTSRTIT